MARGGQVEHPLISAVAGLALGALVRCTPAISVSSVTIGPRKISFDTSETKSPAYPARLAGPNSTSKVLWRAAAGFLVLAQSWRSQRFLYALVRAPQLRFLVLNSDSQLRCVAPVSLCPSFLTGP